jgi:hypothetical protein
MSAEHRRGWWWFRELLLCLLVAAVGIAIVVGVLGGLQLWWYLDRTTVAEVESMISENLSPGTSIEEVVAFLDSRDIDYGSIGPVDGTSYLLDAGYPSDTMVIGAFIYNTSRDFIIRGDIQIFFILDDDYRLREWLVREVFTGL